LKLYIGFHNKDLDYCRGASGNTGARSPEAQDLGVKGLGAH